jgi:hypothetical protein
VNVASRRASRRGIKRDRTNQPGSIFPQSPGIILENFSVNFRFHSPAVPILESPADWKVSCALPGLFVTSPARALILSRLSPSFVWQIPQ